MLGCGEDWTGMLFKRGSNKTENGNSKDDEIVWLNTDDSNSVYE